MGGTPIQVSFEGVKYPSMSALARAYNMCPLKLHNRIKSGHTLADALNLKPFQNLRIVKERSEWMVKLGWSVDGLCTSAIWAQWKIVLGFLNRDFTAGGIASLVGVNHTTILRDLKQCGIKSRPRGGANYRGKEYHRRAENAEMRRLQMARGGRLPEQDRQSMCGVG